VAFFVIPVTVACGALLDFDVTGPDAGGDGSTEASRPDGSERVEAGGKGDVGTKDVLVRDVTSERTDAGCIPGASPDLVGCADAQPQVCSDGLWQNIGAPCAGANPVCLKGACVVCAPGLTMCNGQQPQKCNDEGAWENHGDACVNTTCIAGACEGVCSPNEAKCGDASTPYVCADGEWQAQSPCTGETPVCAAFDAGRMSDRSARGAALVLLGASIGAVARRRLRRSSLTPAPSSISYIACPRVSATLGSSVALIPDTSALSTTLPAECTYRGRSGALLAAIR
jgi:hypothetical protein